MVENEYFWIKKDPAAQPVANADGLDRTTYSYFMDEAAFSRIDDGVAYYSLKTYSPRCDIIFEPTFMIHDHLQALFGFLEPDIQFKGVQLYDINDKEEGEKPLYWVPFLNYVEAIHETSEIIRGKAVKLVLKREALQNELGFERRIIHCRLPAQDIWILTLEAAECLLRRQPVGVTLERVDISK